ncbi:unnamed protein product [Prunus brigantina]
MEINRFSLRNPLNNLRLFNFTQILTLTALTSVHDILAFVIPILLTFVQMKYPNENLFKTRPVAMNIVLYTLLAYSFAFGVRHRFLNPDNPYPWFHMAMLLFGFASLASILSLVFPNYYYSWAFMLCVLSILLLFGWLLLGLARRLWRQIQAQIGHRIFPRPIRAIRRRMRKLRPILPLTMPYQQVGPFAVTPMITQ